MQSIAVTAIDATGRRQSKEYAAMVGKNRNAELPAIRR